MESEAEFTKRVKRKIRIQHDVKRKSLRIRFELGGKKTEIERRYKNGSFEGAMASIISKEKWKRTYSRAKKS